MRFMIYFCFFATLANTVYTMEKPVVSLFLTTALINNEHSKARKEEYLRSFAQFKKLGYERPYMVEGVTLTGPTFLEENTDKERVYYFQGNRPDDKNKGKFEGMSMRDALQHFKLDPSSLVYKHTGRYFATKDLAKVVKEFPGHDAYVQRDKKKGWLLAMTYIFKYGKLQKMYESLDYDAMEREWDPANPEAAFIENYTTRYIEQAEQEEGLDVFHIPGELGVVCNIAHSTTGVDPNSRANY